MSTASLKAAQIIRCINACISCLASTFIMLMILTEPKTRLASPYSRIIFAMSIADILFSLGMLLSPFMGPKDNPDALFAIGTTESCEAIGFIFSIGLLCLLFYTVFLTYYFMRRIKYKVTPQNFAKKEEKYFHRIFCFIAFFLAISNLATGSINPQAYGSVCSIAQPYPEGCNQSLDMICERGDDKVTKILIVCLTLIGGSSFIGILVILALTVHHVYKVERTFTIPAREIGNVNRSHRQRQDNNVVAEQNPHQNPNRNQNPNQMMLTKQALHQSLLYILAFCAVWLPLGISNIQTKFLNEIKEPEWRFWLMSCLTPLGGVFNILIYTRPKVFKLKEIMPNASYMDLLTVIVVYGGEIPSMADLLEARAMADLLEARATTARRQEQHGDEVQGEEVEEGQFEDDRREYLSEDAISYPSYSSNDLISYDLDVSSEVEILKRMKESGQNLFSVMRQQ